ncbi:hypothetical protein YC2023_112106 [Brassica napus]
MRKQVKQKCVNHTIILDAACNNPRGPPHSSFSYYATYCLCKDGTEDNALQASIDYVCGKLDCNPILDKGACYQPNTIKSHCDWAVNSYFQNVAQAPGSCDFSGTATTSQNPSPSLQGRFLQLHHHREQSRQTEPLLQPTVLLFINTSASDVTFVWRQRHPHRSVFGSLLGRKGSFSRHCGAIYCLCKDGIGDNGLQTSIDYACGTLADCNPIHDKGACYQPNTIKNHCDWAVNSYFQKAAQVPGSCNFSGTATTSQTPPSNLVTGCIYPSSAR